VRSPAVFAHALHSASRPLQIRGRAGAQAAGASHIFLSLHRVQLPALHELPEPFLWVWRDVSVAVELDIDCILGSMRDHTSKQKILITIEPVADLLRRETELRDRDNNRVVSANNIVGDALLSCRRRSTTPADLNFLVTITFVYAPPRGVKPERKLTGSAFSSSAFA
jgi:hypothetical protein